MRLQTAVPRGRNDRGAITTWIAIAVGVVALVLGILALARSSGSKTADVPPSQAMSSTPGRSDAAPRQSVIRVKDAPDLDDTSVIFVGSPDQPNFNAWLGPVNTDKDRFVIRLSKKAPASGLTVPWIVTQPASPATVGGSDGSGGSGWDSQWTVLIIITVALLVSAFLAYAVAVRGRSSGTVDHGLELTAFLKVAALLTISALAVMVVLLATEEDAQNLTALFTLFGTIAGYLAGTRTTRGGDEDEGDGTAGDDGKTRATGPGRASRDRSKPKTMRTPRQTSI